MQSTRGKWALWVCILCGLRSLIRGSMKRSARRDGAQNSQWVGNSEWHVSVAQVSSQWVQICSEPCGWVKQTKEKPQKKNQKNLGPATKKAQKSQKSTPKNLSQALLFCVWLHTQYYWAWLILLVLFKEMLPSMCQLVWLVWDHYLQSINSNNV